jgi:hypothetical protein
MKWPKYATVIDLAFLDRNYESDLPGKNPAHL